VGYKQAGERGTEERESSDDAQAQVNASRYVIVAAVKARMVDGRKSEHKRRRRHACAA
jgi:hypothetical protein